MGYTVCGNSATQHWNLVKDRSAHAGMDLLIVKNMRPFSNMTCMLMQEKGNNYLQVNSGHAAPETYPLEELPDACCSGEHILVRNGIGWHAVGEMCFKTLRT
jgi:hypothetical protein